jgi:hypothetical protein
MDFEFASAPSLAALKRLMHLLRLTIESGTIYEQLITDPLEGLRELFGLERIRLRGGLLQQSTRPLLLKVPHRLA